MIPIAKPLLGEEEKRAVIEVLESGMLAQGKKVAEFEQQFASYIGVKHGIACSNGTTALHAALVAHGLKAGDEVITTPFTFIATANAIRMTGAVPVFVDIDDTYNLDPRKIEAAITPRTKAILPVHLFGRPADMAAITTIAERYKLLVIEDACQSHGAITLGKRTGSFGTGCFSFYPTKNITTGEGGMVTTNDADLASKIRKLISHGSEKRYYHEMLGFNYRMTDIAASIGIEQLRKIDYFTRKRQEHAAYLSEYLAPLSGIIVPTITPGHVFHQYTIRITPSFSKTREQVMSYLAEQGIGSSIFYPVPIHQQQAYPEYRFQHFPHAERIAQEVLSLPVHPSLSISELQKIVRAFKEMADKAGNKQI